MCVWCVLDFTTSQTWVRSTGRCYCVWVDQWKYTERAIPTNDEAASKHNHSNQPKPFFFFTSTHSFNSSFVWKTCTRRINKIETIINCLFQWNWTLDAIWLKEFSVHFVTRDAFSVCLCIDVFFFNPTGLSFHRHFSNSGDSNRGSMACHHISTGKDEVIENEIVART